MTAHQALVEAVAAEIALPEIRAMIEFCEERAAVASTAADAHVWFEARAPLIDVAARRLM
jgi:hypothetical protein